MLKLKKLCVVCFVVPLMLSASTSYVTEPTGDEFVVQNIEILKQDMESIKGLTSQIGYDRLTEKLKNGEVLNEDVKSIYYVVVSFLKAQKGLMISEKHLKDKLTYLLDALTWLHTYKTRDEFSGKVTNLGRLLDLEFFIHLDHKQMSKCLDIANEIKKVVEFTGIMNDTTPEDGPDYYNPDFFLSDKISEAEAFFNMVVEKETQVQGFTQDCEKLTEEQLEKRIDAANSFRNQLTATCFVDGKEIELPRNTRKHLENLVSAAITKLTNVLNPS